ncbi:MAG: hypothetical protein ACRDVE_05285 [Actinocrinis sp.]
MDGEHGYFRVGVIGDRRTLISPRGRRFVNIGVAHAEPTNLQYPHNLALWRERYGADRRTWIRDGLVRDLDAWGFTAIGGTEEYVSGSGLGVTGTPVDIGHSHGWYPDDYAAAGMPYAVPLRPLEIEAWNGHPAYRDPTSAAFDEYCDYLARATCAPHADDANLIGFFLVDGPSWAGHPTGADFPALRGLDAASRAAALGEHDRQADPDRRHRQPVRHRDEPAARERHPRPGRPRAALHPHPDSTRGPDVVPGLELVRLRREPGSRGRNEGPLRRAVPRVHRTGHRVQPPHPR